MFSDPSVPRTMRGETGERRLGVNRNVAFKVGLLGLGTVGTGTAQILLDPDQRHPLIRELELYRVGVRSVDKPRTVQLDPTILSTDLDAIVTDPLVDIVVELLGGLEPPRSLILKAIAHGKHIVTANKAVIARYGPEIFDAASKAGVYVLLEAAVGGGIPVIEPLKQSLCSNRIQSVLGIVNGTTNYILTRMQTEGGNFSDILADAQRLGYAEADPTADVDGWDAADKIAILASLAFGGRIDRDQVHCEGIRQITATDISYAERFGFVIKLLAIACREPSSRSPQSSQEKLPDQTFPNQKLSDQKLELRVHPTLVPKDHPLANVNDVFNAILVEGDPVGPVMFYGRGAGAGPTASAVVADVLNIAAILKVERASVPQPVSREGDFPLLDPLLACSHQNYCAIAPMEDLVTRFYSRILTEDQPGVIGSLGTAFGNHGVSLELLVQISSQDGLAEIVVVTHTVKEGDFQKALDDIRQLPTVQNIPSVLRVL